MTVKKRILICPLDWGLGHASRVAKITKILIKRGHEVILAGSGQSLALLKLEFPGKSFIPLPSPEIRYDRKIPAWWRILFLAPKLIFHIIREHRVLMNIIREHQIDVILSDARYGLWHASTPSVLVTHQLAPKLPVKCRFMERFITGINRKAIKQFTACWIPDYQGVPNLSGRLSHGRRMPENTRFIGPVSRFEIMEHSHDLEMKYELVVVISGPEPQRSVFEELLSGQLAVLPMKSLIVCGRPDRTERIKISEFCTSISFLTAEKLLDYLFPARYIICRSGYSGIMDLVSLNKKAFLVPTPGQTEQEYLADYLAGNNMFPSCSQEEFDLKKAIAVLEDYHPQYPYSARDLLSEAIHELEMMTGFSKPTSQRGQ